MTRRTLAGRMSSLRSGFVTSTSMQAYRGGLVDRNAAKDHRGGLTFVIERDSGRVMSFPSFVPPSFVMTDYDEALPDALPEDF